jgi:hypothetical protein
MVVMSYGSCPIGPASSWAACSGGLCAGQHQIELSLGVCVCGGRGEFRDFKDVGLVVSMNSWVACSCVVVTAAD